MKIMKLIAVFAILGSLTANAEPTVHCTVRDNYPIELKHTPEPAVLAERDVGDAPAGTRLDVGLVQGFPISVSVGEKNYRIRSICVDIIGAWICANSDTILIDSVPRSQIHCEVKTISQ